MKTTDEIFEAYCKSLKVDTNDTIIMPWWLKEEFKKIIGFTLNEVNS